LLKRQKGEGVGEGEGEGEGEGGKSVPDQTFILCAASAGSVLDFLSRLRPVTLGNTVNLLTLHCT